jgi:uncharacterized membrane protein YdfJ with MMPL/SSD domain
VLWYLFCLIVGMIVMPLIDKAIQSRKWNKQYEDAIQRLRKGRKMLQEEQYSNNKDVIAFTEQAEKDFVDLFWY